MVANGFRVRAPTKGIYSLGQWWMCVVGIALPPGQFLCQDVIGLPGNGVMLEEAGESRAERRAHSVGKNRRIFGGPERFERGAGAVNALETFDQGYGIDDSRS